MINNNEVDYPSSSGKPSLPPNSPDSKTVIPSTLRTVRRKLDSYDYLYYRIYLFLFP